MTAAIVLGVIALAQTAFIVLLVLFLLVRRQVTRARRLAFSAGRDELMRPMGAWLVGSGTVEELVVALRRLPGSTAIGFTSNLVRTTIPLAARDSLARALRNEAWITRGLAGTWSFFWGRRLEAARCLSLVGAPEDAPLLRLLLGDKIPAVAVAAVAALPRVADEGLIDEMLGQLAMLQTVVRLYLTTTLREMRERVEPPLIARLGSTAPPTSLARWIELAGALELGGALDRAALLATHESPEVRRAVAHALRRAPSKRTADRLAGMLHDGDATVRAAAAHALGELASPIAIPALVLAVRDSAWHVRYRATLALSQLGEAGREALRSLRGDSDRYVADMAVLISGLTDGALLDMVED